MKNLLWVIDDYFHMIKGGVMMIIHGYPPRHYLGYVKSGKVPIVLVPGYLGRWGFYKDLADVLSLEGHPIYIVPKLKSNMQDIPTSAKIVKEIIKKNDIKNGIIISHSKGGLIGKYLLSHYNKDKRIIGMVSVATPYYGSDLANVLPIPSVKEFAPESEVIEHLQEHENVNSKIISIGAVLDNHIWSKEGTYLEGAENILVNVKGHHKIIFCKEIENQIFTSIEKITNQIKI